MILPRSLKLFEPRPERMTWRCSVHGLLPEGATDCSTCDTPSFLAVAMGLAPSGIQCPDEVSA